MYNAIADFDRYMKRDILNKPLEELGFSVRTSNCLKNAGFNTIQDILEVGIENVAKIHPFLEKSAKEITEVLSVYKVNIPKKANIPKDEPVLVTREHLDRFNAAISTKAKNTQETYSIYINKFLNFSDDCLSRNKVILFLNQEVSKNSGATAYYAIRFFVILQGYHFHLM